MDDCPICKNNPDRLAEKVAHEVLDWISEKEGYARVIHAKPNSLRDRQGKDFIIVPKGKRVGLFIQIKAFRILKKSILTAKLQRMKAGVKLRKGRSQKLDTTDKLKRFLLGLLKDSRKLELCVNDAKYLSHFKKMTKNIGLENLIESENDYDKLLAFYGKLEAYFNLMEKEIRHADMYPNVKVFLLADTTDGSIDKKQAEKLKQEWLPIVRDAMNKLIS